MSCDPTLYLSKVIDRAYRSTVLYQVITPCPQANAVFHLAPSFLVLVSFVSYRLRHLYPTPPSSTYPVSNGAVLGKHSSSSTLLRIVI